MNWTAAEGAVVLRERDELRAQVAEKDDEIERLKKEHSRACEIIAQMHHAAFGVICGPRICPVEDIAAFRTENLTLAAQVAKMRAVIEHELSWRGDGDTYPSVVDLRDALALDPTATERYVRAAIELADAVESEVEPEGWLVDLYQEYNEARDALEGGK